MKTTNRNQKFLSMVLVAAVVSACSLKKSSDALSSAQMAYNLTDPNHDIPGMGSTSVPTADGVIQRIVLGTEGRVNPANGNFRTILTQVGANLHQNANGLLATGFDLTPLVAYAACADINTTTTQSAYNVNTNAGQSITAQKAALVAAGLRMTDQFVGGLASSGPYSAQATAIFGKLVDDNATIAGETARQAFISVCMTALEFGTEMRGF